LKRHLFASFAAASRSSSFRRGCFFGTDRLTPRRTSLLRAPEKSCLRLEKFDLFGC
jgi:hypothetical protein